MEKRIQGKKMKKKKKKEKETSQTNAYWEIVQIYFIFISSDICV